MGTTWDEAEELATNRAEWRSIWMRDELRCWSNGKVMQLLVDGSQLAWEKQTDGQKSKTAAAT